MGRLSPRRGARAGALRELGEQLLELLLGRLQLRHHLLLLALLLAHGIEQLPALVARAKKSLLLLLGLEADRTDVFLLARELVLRAPHVCDRLAYFVGEATILRGNEQEPVETPHEIHRRRRAQNDLQPGLLADFVDVAQPVPED